MTPSANDRTLILMLTAVVALATTPAMAQMSHKADDAGWTVKVYRVDDLVVPSPNYPFRGTALPDLSQRGRRAGHFGSQSGMMAGSMGEAMGGGGNQDGPGNAMGAAGAMGGPSGGMAMGIGMTGIGLMGGMGGPMGEGGGIGRQTSGFSMTVPGLIEAIKTFIDPASWQDLNHESYDAGDIRSLGGSLVVRQTPAAHGKIEAFLQELRQELGAMRTLTVQAHWLSLDSQQLAKLLGDDGQQATGNVIDRAAWKEIASANHTVQPYRGQVTCFNGQTVHIVSGRLHSVLQGGMPITSGSAVGYQPLTLTPHIGAMLQITPSLLPGRQSALLDVQSTVTRWDGSPETDHAATRAAAIEARQSKLAADAAEPADDEEADPAQRQPGTRAGRRAPSRGAMSGSAGGMAPMGGMGMGGGMGMAMMGGGMGMPGMAMDEKSRERHGIEPAVDRVNIVAQQLATSLRVPLGQPILVGGMTFPESHSDEPAGEQLYLVIEVTVQEEEDPAEPTEIRSPRRNRR